VADRLKQERAPEPSATATPTLTVSGYKVEHPVTLNLEPWILEGIAKIVAHWANAEWRLTGVAALLHGYGRKESRKKLSGRAEDALAEIRYGFAQAKFPASAILTGIEERVPTMADVRNSVAHGVWIEDHNLGKVTLQRVSGAWDIAGKTVGSKKEMPESFEVSPEWFAEQVAHIAVFIEDMKEFEREVLALVGEAQ
jgi:hypothetical protein